MVKSTVAPLQKSLAYLKYIIDEDELTDGVFGKTTREAIIQLQKDNGLNVTGEVNRVTAKIINDKIIKANPQLSLTYLTSTGLRCFRRKGL